MKGCIITGQAPYHMPHLFTATANSTMIYALSCMGSAFNATNSQCALSNNNVFEALHKSAPKQKNICNTEKRHILTLPWFITTTISDIYNSHCSYRNVQTKPVLLCCISYRTVRDKAHLARLQFKIHYMYLVCECMCIHI